MEALAFKIRYLIELVDKWTSNSALLNANNWYYGSADLNARSMNA